MLGDTPVRKPTNRLSCALKEKDVIEIKEEEEEEAGIQDGATGAEDLRGGADHAEVNEYNRCKETTLREIIDCDQPSEETVILQASFTTLTSQLMFEPSYRLTAIVTDGQLFLDVILRDEVLEGLVGHTAKEVQDAAAGKLPRPQ